MEIFDHFMIYFFETEIFIFYFPRSSSEKSPTDSLQKEVQESFRFPKIE